jgi:thymidylate kinase
VDYQGRLSVLFDQMAKEYGFVTIDAGRSVKDVFEDLQAQIRNLLEDQTIKS